MQWSALLPHRKKACGFPANALVQCYVHFKLIGKSKLSVGGIVSADSRVKLVTSPECNPAFGSRQLEWLILSAGEAVKENRWT